jgi:hypothetical protein
VTFIRIDLVLEEELKQFEGAFERDKILET